MNNKYYLHSILFTLSVITITLLSAQTSPLFIHPGGDAAFFKMAGRSIIQGRTFYQDLFDHKGFFIFLINAFGIFLGKYGLFVLEILSLFISLVTIVSIEQQLNALSNVYSKIIVIITFLLGVHCYIQNGNLTEEWCLPFILIPIWYYCKWLKCHDKLLSLKTIFIIGICMGMCVCYRINNMAPVIGFALMYATEKLIKKEYTHLLFSVGLLTASAILPLLLCCIYFYIKAGEEGVNEMIFGTFMFNLEYIKTVGSEEYTVWQRVFFILPILPYFFYTVFATRKSNYLINIPLIISYLICYFSMGHSLFAHYLMVFVPLIAISAVNAMTENRTFHSLILILVFFAIAGIKPTVALASKLKHDLVWNIERNRCNREFGEILKKINIEERRDIWNWNCCDGISSEPLGNNDFVQKNRVFWPFQLNVSKHLYNKEYHKLMTVKPAWIIVNISAQPHDSEEFNFIHDNYSAQYKIENFNHTSIVFYKRRK